MSLTAAPSPCLSTLLSDLLPACADSGFPAADPIALSALAQRQNSSQTIHLLLETLETIAMARGCAYAELDPAARQTLVMELRRKHLRIFSEFFTLAIQSYCLDPKVQQALSESPRPPFPDGFTVPDGDLERLEVVYERGPCYRPC